MCVCRMSKSVCGLLESCRWMEEKKEEASTFLLSVSLSQVFPWRHGSRVGHWCACVCVSVCESVWAEPLHRSSTVGVGAAILLGLIIFNFSQQIESEREAERREEESRSEGLWGIKKKQSNRF